ncbi:MAG: D-sedoheptulose 7-phosphate isomerase [Verrucomicrobiales bacterium]|jgi:D-sedoheptulose 7-phosphate isomerase|nr:D-sedoheptulose 7-phosphate isomerase [Verrucomicrobiales bacterium]
MSSSSKLIQKTIAEHTVTVAAFQDSCSGVIEQMAAQCVKALEAGNKICFFGNGGSAADAQHFAAEFVVRFTRNRKGLPSLAFTTDTSVLTACANDFGFEAVFARQVEALCTPGDIVVGISTSGNSPNVVKGLEIAKASGVTTFAFTGAGGGRCGELADFLLAVPSGVTARVQECHLIAGHLICDLGEIAFGETVSAISAS